MFHYRHYTINRVDRKPCRALQARASLKTMSESDDTLLKAIIDRTGFAIVPNVLDDPICRLLLKRIDDVNEQAGSLVRSGVVHALMPTRDVSSPQAGGFDHATADSPCFFRIDLTDASARHPS